MRAKTSLVLMKGSIMSDINTIDKKDNPRQNHSYEKDGLREWVTYVLLRTFIFTVLIMIAGGLWLHEWHLSVMAFMALSFLTIAIITPLFGQRKMTESLCDIIKEIIKLFTNKG
jgi:hypothetical protein